MLNPSHHSVLKSVIAVLFGLCAVLACSEVIDLKNDNDRKQLVIFGRITDGGMGNLVNITRTLPEGQSPETVSGAVVTIFRENGEQEQLVETTPGNYELCGDRLQGVPGGIYHLQVDFDGKVYTSELQEMMPIISRDELRYELDIEEGISNRGVATSSDVVRVFANTSFDELQEEFYIRWAMEEAYTAVAMDLPRSWFPRYSPMVCYIINELSAQDIFLVDGTEIRNVNLNNREVAVRQIDRSFGVSHYFNIIQFALNKESHEYWSKLKSLTERQGSIFDTPPAAVSGNITSSDPSEDVFGFFEASSVDTSRVLLTNNDIPLFFLDPCQVDRDLFLQIISVPFECAPCLVTEKLVPETCIFCNRFENSTLERPSYY
ncbi:hypothetical protein BFP97_12465 [Roseivirga sp. 4D4]|uniref:DUF4249 domain-containing protein n=1 Tax=Roseivirga sp. 4D4 TaxID=1889784 RepID=UPI000852EFF3|nr:DUF4249 domain-containing protein [Roseivirga sp. 4D4]OEK02281.1 hypothetical protein BFP97_12465 [Roseivirga sp. 4D4]